MASCGRLPLHPFLSSASVRLACYRNVQVEASITKSLYPPVLPSRTAKSKSAKRRLVTEFFEQLRSCTAHEKIQALTRVQHKKYVIYPQTFALNPDRWYQHYTKTAFLSGLPEKYATESAPGVNESLLSEVRSVVCNSILQEQWHAKKGRTFTNKEQEKLVSPFLRNAVCGLKNLLAKENPVLGLSSLGGFDLQFALYCNAGFSFCNVYCLLCFMWCSVYFLKILTLKSTITGYGEKGLFPRATGEDGWSPWDSRLMTDLTVRSGSHSSFRRCGPYLTSCLW